MRDTTRMCELVVVATLLCCLIDANWAQSIQTTAERQFNFMKSWQYFFISVPKLLSNKNKHLKQQKHGLEFYQKNIVLPELIHIQNK